MADSVNGRIEFDYRFADQRALMGRLRSRVYSGAFFPVLFALTLGPVVAGALLSYWLSEQLVGTTLGLVVSWLPLIGGVAGVFVASRLFQTWARRTDGSGSTDGAPCSFEIKPEHFVWASPYARVEVGWPGVDLIDDGPNAVIFIVRGSGYFVPRRAFADDEARRSFITACAAHLTPEAKARSGLAA